MKKNIIFLMIVFICFCKLDTFSSIYPPASDCPSGFSCTPPPKSEIKNLQRKFQKTVSDTKNYLFTNNSGKNNFKGGISLALADMQQIYQTSDIEYNFSEEGVNYTMDIGTVDYVNSQVWVMPQIDFIEYEIGENAVVASSTYYSNFPTATHLQFYDYSEWNEFYYEYYKFSANQIEIIGAAYEYDGGTDIETMSYIVTPLPLDINLDFSDTEEYIYQDTTFIFTNTSKAEGFGTLETDAGDIYNAIKVANTCQIDIYFNAVLIQSAEETIYTFFCENGYRLNLYLTPTSATTGVIETDYIDVEIPSALNNITELSEQNDFCYPNPATDILNFYETGNYKIYNSLGSLILNLQNVKNLDISNLNSGLYFVKSETGKTQKIIVD